MVTCCELCSESHVIFVPQSSSTHLPTVNTQNTDCCMSRVSPVYSVNSIHNCPVCMPELCPLYIVCENCKYMQLLPLMLSGCGN